MPLENTRTCTWQCNQPRDTGRVAKNGVTRCMLTATTAHADVANNYVVTRCMLTAMSWAVHAHVDVASHYAVRRCMRTATSWAVRVAAASHYAVTRCMFTATSCVLLRRGKHTTVHAHVAVARAWRHADRFGRTPGLSTTSSSIFTSAKLVLARHTCARGMAQQHSHTKNTVGAGSASV